MGKVGLISSEWRCYAAGGVMLVLTVLLFTALVTDGFVAGERPGRPMDGMLSVPNALGAPGAFVAGSAAFVVGDAAHIIYAILFLWTLMLCNQQPLDRILTRITGLLLLVGAVAGLLQIDLSAGASNPQAGGAFGAFMAERIFLPYFGRLGSNVLGLALAFIGMLLATDFLFIHMLLVVHRVVCAVGRGIMGLAMASVGLGGRYRAWHSAGRIRAARPITVTLPEDEIPLDEPPATEKDDLFDKLLGLSAAPPRIHVQETPPWMEEEVQEKKKPRPQPKSILGPVRQIHTPVLRDVQPPPPSPFDDIPKMPPVQSAPLQAAMQTRLDSAFSMDDEDEAADSIAILRDAAANPADIISGKHRAKTQSQPPSELPMCEEDEDPVFTPTPETDHRVVPFPSVAPVVETREAMGGDLRTPAVRLNRPPRPRRKIVETDEVPDDYVYPKRYTKPSMDLFTQPQSRIIPNLREKLNKMAVQLQETLRTFGIEARVTDITRGPTVTRLELEPAPGIKVSRFLALTDDIALALEARGVRVEAPIPGKARVGIEVSNEERDPVVIRELLEHAAFRGAGKGKLSLALGKGISGEVCIADLARMPHLLVAGATGAGKTVCVKALLASLLLQHTPDELQLVLIDPKMVELSIFNDIPHLITPVVTDPRKAATSLAWLINEMEERYRLFADLRVRNIEVYNASVENGEIELVGTEADPAGKMFNVVRRLPYIVCVIDELADLMILARAEVEDAIARLAQLARAVGIHLIIATQRPSVDVLTGVIKANFPARISFQVSSRVDSRCILDEIGAERLVGMGDMLYLPAGQSKPDRIQGAFVSDDEMNALVAYLKRQAPPQYRDEIENFGKSKDSMSELDADDDDPLFEDAVRVVLETGQASISMVQRRLRVGYTRAARLIDMMELRGIVGPHTGSKAREILVDTPPRDDGT